jgi:hypothetical protein
VSSDLGYYDALRYYARARRQAFDLVRHLLLERGIVDESFSISRIDPRAVQAWERTWRGTPHWSTKGGFHWALLAHQFCRKPRNFSAALWVGDELCGLAVGRLSPSHDVLTLHFMEGSPRPEHPLRANVARFIFACAEYYGAAVGARTLLLKNPDAALEGYYGRLGYGVAYDAGNARYCKRTL